MSPGIPQVLKVLKNSLKLLKVLKNGLKVLKVLQMELQENSSIDEVESLSINVDFMMRLFKSDSKYSDAFSQFESARASGSGGSGGYDQEDEDGDGDRNLPIIFCLKINHGGAFIKSPMIRYKGGKGLRKLTTDSDVLEMLRFVSKYKEPINVDHSVSKALMLNEPINLDDFLDDDADDVLDDSSKNVDNVGQFSKNVDNVGQSKRNRNVDNVVINVHVANEGNAVSEHESKNEYGSDSDDTGGKDHPPILAPSNYVQWKSKIKRYIVTKPNLELIHYCLDNPPHKFKWAERTIPVTEGIDNDIYSTVDACPNACEMWNAIKRLKQEEAGIELSDEQVDWRDGTDDELEDQELEEHYLYMEKIQEVTPDAADNSGLIFDAEPLQKVQNNDDNYNVFANDREHPKQPESVNDTYPDKQGDTNITNDSLVMSTNGEKADQDDDDLARERDLLASLI
nr:transposase, MuDR [Tanacetum cinerariifolium]